MARHETIRLQNIRIAVAARRHHFDDTVGVPFLCECDDVLCCDFVVVTLPAHARAKKDRLVLVATGHRVADGELVGEEGDHQVYRLRSPTTAAG